MTSEKALSGEVVGLMFGAALLAFALWYSYSIGHMRGEVAGIRWMREQSAMRSTAERAMLGQATDALEECAKRLPP